MSDTAIDSSKIKPASHSVDASLNARIAQIFQNDMLDKLADITPDRVHNTEAQQKLVAEKATDLERERDIGIWGPESRRDYNNYINWIKETAIPKTIADLNSSGLSIPPGYPQKLPTTDTLVLNDRQNIPPPNSDELATTSEMQSDRGPQPAPTLADLAKVMAVKDWATRARDAIDDKESARLFEQDKQLIGHGLPASWTLAAGQDLQQYKAALRVGADLYNQIGKAAIAVDALRKLGDSELEYPPGVAVVIDAQGKVNPTVDLPNKLADLPFDPRIKQYTNWYDKVYPHIQKDAQNLKLAERNPYFNLLYGNVELPFVTTADGHNASKQAVLDSEGNLLRIIDPAKGQPPAPPGNQAGKPQERYSQINVDMLQQRFTAKRENPRDFNSDIVVDISVQAQQGRIGYDLFNQDAGNPLLLEQPQLKANDMVVYNGQLVQARTLPARMEEDRILYDAGKIFNIALDASMFVGGVSIIAKSAMRGVGAAAAELATGEAKVAGGEAIGVGITAGAANTALTRGAADMLAGVQGSIGNNAWGHKYEPWIDNSRSPYFVTTGVAPMFRSMDTVLSGGNAIQAALKETGPAWLRATSNLSDTTMKVLMPVMAGQISWGLGSKIDHDYEILKHKNEPSPLAEGLLAAAAMPDRTMISTWDKAGSAKADGISLNQVAEAFKAAFRTAGQVNAPESGSDNNEAQQIMTVVAGWHKLSQAERDQARETWAVNVTFTAEEIKSLEVANEGKLSEQQLHCLIDPEQRVLLPQAVRALAEQPLDSRNSDKFPGLDPAVSPYLDNDARIKLEQSRRQINEDIRMASRVALLMTAISPDGAVPSVLASKKVQVDAHVLLDWPSHFGVPVPIPAMVKTREVSENVDYESVISGLRSDLARQTSPEKMVALSSLLAGAKAIPPEQFSSIIKRVLSEPNATSQEKIHLLTAAVGPLTTYVLHGLYEDATKISDPSLDRDEKSTAEALNFGNGYGELMKTLATSAASDPDEKVRAMSAIIYSGARELASNVDRQAIIANMTSDLQGVQNGRPGHLIDPLRDSMIKQLSTPLPEGDASSSIQRRLDAAMTLMVLAAPEHDRSRLDRKVCAAMTEAFVKSDRSQALELLNTLPVDVLRQMSADPAFRKHLARLVPSPEEAASSSGQVDSVKLLADLSEVIGTAESGDFFGNKRASAFQSDGRNGRHLNDQHLSKDPHTLGSIDGTTSANSDLQSRLEALIDARNHLSVAFPYVQAAAIQAVAATDMRSTVPLLEKLAGDVNEATPQARAAALKALVQMKDPAIQGLVPNLLARETDLQIRKDLIALQARWGSSSPKEEAKANPDSGRLVDERQLHIEYPALADFDATARQKFLQDNHLALMDHQLFVAEAQSSVQAKWGTNTMNNQDPESAMSDLFKQRDQQFQALLSLARGDVSSPATEMARSYLADIAFDGGKCVTGNDHSYLLAVNHEGGGAQPWTFNDSTNLFSLTTSFDTAAAKELATLAMAGDNGYDLNRHLVDRLLSNSISLSPDGLTALAEAWKTMYQADPGHTILTTEQYMRVVARALENARSRKDALQSKYAAEGMSASSKNNVVKIENTRMELHSEDIAFTKLEDKLSSMLAAANAI